MLTAPIFKIESLTQSSKCVPELQSDVDGDTNNEENCVVGGGDETDTFDVL